MENNKELNTHFFLNVSFDYVFFFQKLVAVKKKICVKLPAKEELYDALSLST